MKQQKYIWGVAIFILTSCAHSAPVDAAPKAVKTKASLSFSTKRLQETYKKAQSIEATFQQEVYQASLARTKTSSGKLALERPSRVHWEVLVPEPSLTISNGTKLWYYTPNVGASGKGQVMVRSAKQLTEQPLFRILTGSADLTKEFKIDQVERLEGIVRGAAVTKLTLLPRRPKFWGDMEQIALTVDANYLISEVLIHNRSGNRTKITLQNQKVGPKLSPKLFDFSPPAGAEVLAD